MLFVISDIHSYYEPMMLALKEKDFFKNDQNKLLVLGDALDRGPDAKKIIDFLLSLNNEGRLIYVRGNHENLFVECLQEIEDGGIFELVCGMSHHCRNGTLSTLLQIAEMNENEALECPYELIERIKQSDYYNVLLPSCVNFYENEKYIFAHGFIPIIRDVKDNVILYRYDHEWRNADSAVWREAVWLNGIDMACKYHITEQNKTIVVGHIHTSYAHQQYGDRNIKKESLIFSANGFMAIDACTPKSGLVNCLVLSDL